MPPKPQLEICVDSVAGLMAAVEGGADRIELCSALGLGGLTPGPGLMAAAVGCGVPCHAMIRPSDGGFVPRAGDMAAMLADIDAVHRAGLAGVVIGASHADGTLDTEVLATLVAAAGGLCVTLHRAFDLTPDPFGALDAAVDLGMTRILTSGQAPTAVAGAMMLRQLVGHAAGRIEIMAGAGVLPEHADPLLAVGVDALHGSCSAADAADPGAAMLGVSPRRVTRAQIVSALKDNMKQRMACA